MKVLICTSDNSLSSGAFRSLVYLAAALEKLNTECLVLLPYKGDGEKLLIRLGIRYQYIKSCKWVRSIDDTSIRNKARWQLKRFFNRTVALNRVRRLCKREDIDLVHIGTSLTYVGALAAVREGLPFVWHIREFLEEDQARTMWDSTRSFELMSKANAVIAVSDSIKRKYDLRLSETHVIRIYNGIDPVAFYAIRPELFSGEEIRMCMVGGLNPGKGQMRLVEALELLASRDALPRFSLKFVGRLSGAEYERNLIARVTMATFADSITFTGLVEHPEDVYHRSDIVFVCSAAEPFARVTVEAMMSGCAVIGANTAGTVEQIIDGRTGFLYEESSAEDLADTITCVINDKESAKRVAQAGQAYAMKEFTAERNARAINDVYKEIVSSIAQK